MYNTIYLINYFIIVLILYIRYIYNNIKCPADFSISQRQGSWVKTKNLKKKTDVWKKISCGIFNGNFQSYASQY